jgi:DNA-3-methyladenine glycosylase II
MVRPKDKICSAVRHLRKHDVVMRALIDAVGPFTLRPERNRFWMLVRSIISQQISLGAARAIRNRLEQLVAPEKVTPESLLRFRPEQLRSAGLSPQKTAYILDLASKTHDGTVRLRTIGRLPDEQIITQLVQVKGIGRWTAQMFLIFALGRLDVFPHEDLGVRAAIRNLYGLDELPDRATAERIAAPWRPYASVASWYCWRSLDLARNGQNFAKGYPT